MGVMERTPAVSRRWQRARRLARSPKGLVFLILLGLAAIAGPAEGLGRVIPALLVAVIVAAVLDVGATWARQRSWLFPDGAAVSGLIVALVLSPREPLYVPATASLVAIGSKHLLRTPRLKRVNVFNPAAVGLLACIVLFSSRQSWWGALPDLPAPAILPLLAAGYVITERINKLPQVLAFLGAYVGLLAMSALLTHGQSERLAEVFRTPYISAALFFAFFMLTDPVTSPTRAGEQIELGCIVGLSSVCAFLSVPGLYFLLVGLLIGNAWLAWRRAHAHQERHARPRRA